MVFKACDVGIVLKSVQVWNGANEIRTYCLGTNPTQGPQDDQAPAAAIEQVSSSGKMPEALPSQRRSTELGSST